MIFAVRASPLGLPHTLAHSRAMQVSRFEQDATGQGSKEPNVHQSLARLTAGTLVVAVAVAPAVVPTIGGISTWKVVLK